MSTQQPSNLSFPLSRQMRPAGNLVSIIIPTDSAADNLSQLFQQLNELREAHGMHLEVLIMHDDTGDGTEHLIANLNLPWARLVVRRENPGLSQAVLHGMRLAQGQFLAVMNADLSHPPQIIPSLIDALEQGADMAIGSRYMSGGSAGNSWSRLRQFNGRFASLLALPLTRLSDPMSGFFALRPETFLAGCDLNPTGSRIGLELMLKCPVEHVAEIPICISDQQHRRNKRPLRERLRSLQHLSRLYWYTASATHHARPTALKLHAATATALPTRPHARAA